MFVGVKMNQSQQDSMPAPRVPLNLTIEYRKNYARQSEGGNLFNISITGAFLKTDGTLLNPKDKVTLYFEVSGRKRKIQARVIWKNQMGAGLAFQPFNSRDVQIVDDLIYFVESSRENRREVLNTIFKKVSNN